MSRVDLSVFGITDGPASESTLAWVQDQIERVADTENRRLLEIPDPEEEVQESTATEATTFVGDNDPCVQRHPSGSRAVVFDPLISQSTHSPRPPRPTTLLLRPTTVPHPDFRLSNNPSALPNSPTILQRRHGLFYHMTVSTPKESLGLTISTPKKVASTITAPKKPEFPDRLAVIPHPDFRLYPQNPAIAEHGGLTILQRRIDDHGLARLLHDRMKIKTDWADHGYSRRMIEASRKEIEGRQGENAGVGVDAEGDGDLVRVRRLKKLLDELRGKGIAHYVREEGEMWDEPVDKPGDDVWLDLVRNGIEGDVGSY